MDFNEAMKPYKVKLVLEALLKAVMTGLFFGLALSLVSALVCRFILLDVSQIPTLITFGIGIVAAITIGIITYVKRFKSGIDKLARRIDALGLDERVTTMVEFKKDRSFVAKVQREDTMDRLSKLNIKQLRLRIPTARIISCVAMFLVIVFLFAVLPTPLTAEERESIEVAEEIERIRDELHALVDENADKVTPDFVEKAHQQIDDRIDQLLASPDYTNAQKLFLAQ